MTPGARPTPWRRAVVVLSVALLAAWSSLSVPADRPADPCSGAGPVVETAAAADEARASLDAADAIGPLACGLCGQPTEAVAPKPAGAPALGCDRRIAPPEDLPIKAAAVDPGLRPPRG